MFKSDFKKEIIENANLGIDYELEMFIEGVHPHFPNHIDSEWMYPPKPTVHAMYFLGKLKDRLSNYITDFQMALEVCVKTSTNDVAFIDIAVWKGDEKHVIEINGNS